MKATSLISLTIFLFLAACNNRIQKEDTISREAVVDTLQGQVQKPDTGTIIKWKKESWYLAAYQPLCDDTKGRFLDINKFNKYGRHHAYDTLQKLTNDTAFISFDFITDCCIEFSGEAMIRDNILFLGYGLATEEVSPCDCYCDYRMSYKIARKGKQWKKIVIKQGRLDL